MQLRKNIAYVVMASLSVVTAGLLLASAGVANAQTATASVNAPGSNGGAWHGRGGPGMMGRGTLGTVTAINGTTLTVTAKVGPNGATGTIYTVNAANATVTKNGATSSVANIAVGDTVVVAGTVSGTTITATSIHDGVVPGGAGMGMMGGKAPGVFGTVAAVNGDTLTVTSKFGPNGATTTTYTVDATNATVTKNGASSTVSAIAVGDNVMVSGTVSGTNVTATTIRDGMMAGNPGGPRMPVTSPIQGNGEPVIGGAITAINGTSLTVTNKSNVTYTVDASSATIVKGNATSSLSNVDVGDNVVVQGTVNGTAVVASSVIDQGAAPANGTSTGAQGHGGGFAGGILSAIGGFFSHLFGF